MKCIRGALVLLGTICVANVVMGQSGGTGGLIPEEVAALRAQKAAAVALADRLALDVKDYQQALSDARGAVNTANDMLKGSLFAALLVFGVGVFQYVKVSREDRTKLTEQVENTILPNVEKVAMELVRDVVSSIDERIADKESRLQTLDKKISEQDAGIRPHIVRFYRTLTDYYSGSVIRSINAQRWGWAISNALQALDAAHRCGNLVLRQNLLGSYRDIILHGPEHFSHSAAECGWNDEEVDVLDRLLEWIEEPEYRVKLTEMKAFLEEHLRSGAKKTSIPVPFFFPALDKES
jgi:hypothetical protein